MESSWLLLIVGITKEHAGKVTEITQVANKKFIGITLKISTTIKKSTCISYMYTWLQIN